MSETNGRPDGRGPKQLRNLEIEVGILDRADGSARVYLGENMAIATVFGPREMHPKHAALPDRAVVRINYRMATFSVDDYKRPYPSRREKEISKVLSEAYESLILTKNWPRSVVDVHVEIFTSDGGTRTCSAIAITAALADAGLPMRDLAGAIASGLYEDQVVLDMTGHEDMTGTGDMPLMYAPSVDEVSLFQLDGKFTFEQFKEAYFTSKEAIRDIVNKIKEALVTKYIKIRDEYGLDEDEEEIDQDLIDEGDVVKSEIEMREDDEEEVDTEEDDEEIITPVTEMETESVSLSSESETETPQETQEIEMDASETEKSEGSSAIIKALEQDDTPPLSNSMWYTKRGGELKPMPANREGEDLDKIEENEEEDETEDEEDETDSIIRDIEYSLEEEEQ